MPQRPRKPCAQPGCAALTHDRYCAAHAAGDTEQRVTAHQRGYNYRWQKESKQYLAEHPLCANCERTGRTTAARLVDHKIPHRGDQVLFWDQSNWQSLCTTCHSSDKQRIEHRTTTHPHRG